MATFIEFDKYSFVRIDHLSLIGYIVIGRDVNPDGTLPVFLYVHICSQLTNIIIDKIPLEWITPSGDVIDSNGVENIKLRAHQKRQEIIDVCLGKQPNTSFFKLY